MVEVGKEGLVQIVQMHSLTKVFIAHVFDKSSFLMFHSFLLQVEVTGHISLRCVSHNPTYKKETNSPQLSGQSSLIFIWDKLNSYFS